MSKKIFKAIIFGAPGSGKGTMSERIVKKFKMHHIASGDILRQNISQKTDLGIAAEKFIREGKLVPDVFMIKCILDEIDKCKGSSWLLDGFPRTIEQAVKLWNVHTVDSVIKLDVPHNIIIDRIKGRWVHLPSGRIYNITFNAPKIPFKDDITGEPLIQRQDDCPEAVAKRLEIYESITNPVSEFYKNKGILTTFSGETTDEIWPKVEKFIRNKLCT